AAQVTAPRRATRLAREGYLANLASRQRLNAAQIVQLDAQARVSVARSEALTVTAPSVAPAPAPAPAPDPGAGGGRSIVVTATGYALVGTTATGMPVGW